MFVQNCYKLVLAVLLVFGVNQVSAQLSKTHYIPPLTSAEFGNANPENQWLYLSTPNENDVPYTIKLVGQPAFDITGVISNTNSAEIFLGHGNGQLFMPSNTTSVVTSNKGYIIEAEDIIYASVRMEAGSAQAGALVSKGMSALGNTFRIGSYTNENPQNNYLNFVSVMATEDNTNVTFSDLPAGISIKNYNGSLPIPTILLNEGESYIVATNSSENVTNRDGLIGTLVESDKPIVVNCGSANGSFHNGTGRDYGIDQIVDFSKVGDAYIFVKGDGSNDWENVLVVAHQNNTQIFINGSATASATINAGDYHLIEGNLFNSNGNMFVRTSNPVFAYQGIGGGGSEANQGMFFVPPLSCNNRGNVNNIASIDRIGNEFYGGGVTIVTNMGAVVTINNQPLTNFGTNGPFSVDGNPDYETYKVTGLSGNVSVECNAELYCSYFNINGAASSGSFYSGFPSPPEINFEATFETLGNCIDNITLSATNTENFDTYEWYLDEGTGFITTGITTPDLTPTIPGKYKLIGIITCSLLELESVEVPVSICPEDSDIDGIINNLDIDNDNDGILNCQESKGDVTLNITGTPQLLFQNGSINTSLATASYSQNSSSGNTNTFTGTSLGNFSSKVQPAIDAWGNYTITFAEPVNIKFMEDLSVNHNSVDGEYFIAKILPVSKNITLVDPDGRLLVDSNYDGIFETGVTKISGSEIHFKINPIPSGTNPYEFFGDKIDGFSFIHKLSNTNDISSFSGNLSLTCFALDSDGDGIEDALDYDSDNDGIPDIIEAAGSNYLPLSHTDADINGLDDIFDLSATPNDSDTDGVYDYLDLDSDNDGVYDLEESGSLLPDTNFDGIIDNALVFIGLNGWVDTAETSPDSGVISYILSDIDTDTLFNYIDSDSDGDLCSDVIEAGFSDANSDDFLSDTTVIVNSMGKVTNASDGYTNPHINYITAAPISIIQQPIDQELCIFSDSAFTIETSAIDSIHWQVSEDNSNWTTITDSGIYSGTSTRTLLISNAPMSLNNNRYRARLDKDGNSCGLISNMASLTVHPLPVVNPIVQLKQCDNDIDGFSAFNLSEANNKISANASNESFTYFLTEAAARSGDVSSSDFIADPTAFTNNTVSSDVVWSRVESEFTCTEVAEIQLFVSTTGIPTNFQYAYYKCDDFMDINGDNNADNNDRDGISTFNFSEVNNVLLNSGFFPQGQKLIIKYYRNEADALAEANPIQDISNYRNIGYPNRQEIYVRVDSEIDNDCLGFGVHITLNVETLPVANEVTIQRQCDDDQDGFFPFDVSQIESTILNGQTGVTVSYIDENNVPLPSPLPNPFLTESQTITIIVANNSTADAEGPCTDATTLEFTVDTSPIAHPISLPPVCDDDANINDGFYDFDTSTIQSTLLGGQTGMEVHYFDIAGIELSSPLPNPFTSATQTITAQVVNPLNITCSATTTFDLIVNPLPDFSVDSPQILCLTEPESTIYLDAYIDDPYEIYDYEWTDQHGTLLSYTSSVPVSAPGTYSITLFKTDGTNCSRTRDIVVIPSIIADIDLYDIQIEDDSNNNTITINNSTNNLGVGDYEFSLDNEFSFQDEPYFDFVESGIHTIYIRDKNGCGVNSIDISVIGFPRFFTPNNDGYNDTWKVLGVNEIFYPEAKIYIFNRYGKLIKQIEPDSNGWNGHFNGTILPTTDYWFSAELVDLNGNLRIRKGHFSLIR